MKTLRTLITIVLVLGWAGLALNQPLPAPEGRTYFGGLLRLRLPPEWTLTETTDGLTLTAPDGATVEMKSWETPRGGDPSARAAACAHEALLFEQMPYRRSARQPITCRSGQQGLLVTGQVADGGGQLRGTTFAAFACAGRYFVASTLHATDQSGAGETAIRQIVGSVDLVDLPTADTPVAPTEHTGTPAVRVGIPAPVAVLPPTTAVPQPEPELPKPAPTAPEREGTVPQPGPPQGEVTPALIQPQPANPGPMPAEVTSRPPSLGGPSVTPPAASPDEASHSTAALPAPTIPAPSAPTVNPGPEATGPTSPAQPPAVQDVAPAQTVREAGMVREESPLGFSLEHPADWRVQLVEGHLEVVAPPDQGSPVPAAGVIIWPVSQLTVGQDPAELGRHLLAQSQLVGAEAVTLRARLADDVAVLAGKTGGLGAPRRVVACCYVSRDQGMLTAAVARPQEFDQRLPALLHVLESFDGGPWWADTDMPAAKTVLWQEPASGTGSAAHGGWLRLPVPDTWQVSGGVRLVGDVPAIAIEMHSADQPALRCLWRQPLVPLFRELTPVLRNLGWQEGDRYPANVRENALRVSARLSPQDYLTRHWLGEGPSRLENAVIDRLTVTQTAAPVAGQQNAAGVVVMLHGDAAEGPRQRICMVATADAAPGGEPNCWQVGVLEAEAPAGAVAEAMAVLHEAVAGAMVAEDTPAGVAARLREQIGGARLALEAQVGPAQTAVKHADVLAVRNTQARGRLWLCAPDALGPWRRAQQAQAQGQSLDAIMPELTSGYWQ